MKTPFKFLDAFTLKDSESFFGRDKEIKALHKMVFETSLILIYGLSGTGKTSLVQCGLASRFDGPDWLPFFIRRNDNLMVSLHTSLNRCLQDHPRLENASLNRKVSHIATEYLRPIYLIFDQFEELFILGSRDEQQEFIRSVKKLLDAQLLCKIIFIIREEYLGQLYDFERTIPYLFDFRLRVEPMNNKTTALVLNTSFEKFNISLEPPKDERIEQIINNISGEKSGIQLPYLQVYLDMLYREDYHRTYPEGSEEENPPLEFTEQEINSFGHIENVLENFLDEQKEKLQSDVEKLFAVSDQYIAHLLDALVTEEGTKRPVNYHRKGGVILTSGSFREMVLEDDPAVLSYAIEELEKRRIVRFTGSGTFELAHDSLAKLIDQKRTDEQRQRNEILKRIKTSFAEFHQTRQYLSRKQLIYYEPHLPILKLDPEILHFIEQSYAHVAQKEREELQAKEEKIKVAAERKNQRLKTILLNVAGVFAIIAVIAALYAFQQQDIAKKALINEEKANENLRIGSWTRMIGNANTFKAKGNYSEAVVKINEAIQFKNDSLQNIKLQDSLDVDIDAMKISWETAGRYLTLADSILQIEDPKGYKYLEALQNLRLAYATDPENFIREKIENTEQITQQALELWLFRAENMSNYNQCELGTEAGNTAEKLKEYLDGDVFSLTEEEKNTVLTSFAVKINKVNKKIAQSRRKGQCY